MRRQGKYMEKTGLVYQRAWCIYEKIHTRCIHIFICTGMDLNIMSTMSIIHGCSLSCVNNTMINSQHM